MMFGSCQLHRMVLLGSIRLMITMEYYGMLEEQVGAPTGRSALITSSHLLTSHGRSISTLSGLTLLLLYLRL
jgi:hypothetical protein